MNKNEYLHGLSWSTFKIYAFLLTLNRSEINVREFQRQIGFASPSSALFHFEKLVQKGLLRENNGKYFIDKPKKIGPLSYFFLFRGIFIPKDLVYFLLILALMIIDIVIFNIPHTFENVYGFYVPIIICLVFFGYNTVTEFMMLRQILRKH